MLTSLLLFLLCALLIFFSGKQLSVYGDIIAEHLGLGKAWIGLVLMASVTSLPELTVGISAVTRVQSANLALGDIMGSCVFNLFILSLLDVFVPKEPLFSKVSASHVLAGAMSIILVALVGLALYLPTDIIIIPWIGLTSLLFMVVYFVSITIIYRYDQKRKAAETATAAMPPVTSLKKAITLYLLHAALVVGAASFLPGLAHTIATQSGLSESFVATLFLAASTSFPEIAVSLSAIKMRMFDIAVGNLIGSNIFNILILAVDDVFYVKGPLLKDASDSHIVSVFSVVIMSAIAIAGLTYRSPSKKFGMAWDTLLILLMYLINLTLLYHLKT